MGRVRVAYNPRTGRYVAYEVVDTMSFKGSRIVGSGRSRREARQNAR